VSLSLTFWGTRGSIPRPGPSTARYGGNTPCLTIEDGSGQRLILDAGTGIRDLGRALGTRPAPPTDLTILLSHTHWDHIQGLPFFDPLYRPGTRVRIFGPRQPVGSLESIIRAQMDPAVFPVPVDALAASLTVSEFESLDQVIGPFRVASNPLCHPGATVGFRIGLSSEPNGGISYLTDNELGAPGAAAARPRLVRFLRGSDVLVHDAMYFDRELPGRVGWGHSSAAEAALLALESGCPRLVLFHHDPDHDDEALPRLLDEANLVCHRQGGSCEIQIAAEGMTLRCEEVGR
jgi:phosphoribosyl 1,2-cyclic phosphodiesterase